MPLGPPGPPHPTRSGKDLLDPGRRTRYISLCAVARNGAPNGKTGCFDFDGSGLSGYIQPAFSGYFSDLKAMAGNPGGLVNEHLIRAVLGGPAGVATLKVVSSSMRPRLQEGDRISVRSVPLRALVPGDVIVFGSERAGIVVHRLIWRGFPLGQPSRLITKGDALHYLDPATSPGRVLGRVISIERGPEHLRPTTGLDRARCLIQAGRFGLKRWARRLTEGRAARGRVLPREMR